ncbi:carbohydrate ABC transporter membrane protein 1 (CUT1 family) [Paenibacillus taihuensis]|uniref:Carbohydrate ABC transporter membrane protein 1 (CUT1 family) n=1 Tax=Paenibacillus taihuensis TaxID=1156355 RepID=A0A3D9R3Z2_9BACL|nr:sugar ABC transporter permease [Paenibacillus taihuensis]REE70500.1 carbohydrate ABC transporter membrane protein 1 (CUT1 family) [Paenibacillus taihuensis]
MGSIARLRKYFWGYTFIVPAAVIFILFLWMPIVKGFVYSFYHIDFVKGNSYVGFGNFRTVLHDPDVWTAVKNTLYYMFLCLIIGFWVPIVFAIAISELKRFQGFVRVAAYLPNVIPVVVLYGLWRWLYDPVGPINATITQMGNDPIAFMTDTRWSMVSLVFMETWQQFGSAMLIYLAAVLSIPRDLYEAAEIDGAGVWKRIRYITLPFIRNLIVLLFILQLIATSQGFQSQFAMLDGGPNNATLTYALIIVKYAFTRLDYGSASALGVLMFLVLGGLAVLQHRLSNNREGN